MKHLITVLVILWSNLLFAQDSLQTYKKRVLETTEINFISSYYAQDGDNAAVTGGRGTEELTDFASSIVVAIPLNEDAVLAIDAGVSAYTSASSSNVDPFDAATPADPFVASSGASASDLWFNLKGNYSHSSDDRNTIWSANASFSGEYDYTSIGFGGSYTRLFNEKNTELSANISVFLDTWKILYPIELRPIDMTGLAPLEDKGRNSYSIGLGFSQILSEKMQGIVSLDVVSQQGLLSTPFQRVYFADRPDLFAENFQLADDIERLPDTRFKTAIGGRLTYFLNEYVVLRTFYRYYFDSWGIMSQTASLEIPVKITDRFTLYPSYRFYSQTAADQFAAYNKALSTDEFYTSDYDLSKYSAHRYGFGITYTDIFTGLKIASLGLKSIDLNYHYYQRDSGLHFGILTGGVQFLLE